MHDPSETSQKLIKENALLKQRIQELEKSEGKSKRAEDESWESEEQYRSILQTAMDGFWMTDMQGRLLDVNETYARMSGYSISELRTMCITDLEVDETDADTAAHMQKVIVQGEDRFETRHRRKDETVFPVEVSVQYRSADGGRMVAFLHDITKHKEIEKTLREKTNDLNERVKELNCLYGLSELIEKSGNSVNILMQGLVELITSALQYPIKACARITLNGHIFCTANFKQTPWQLQRSILLQGEQIGTLEVFYLEVHPKIDNGLFLQTEVMLLEAVAERLGKGVEIIRTQHALQDSEEKFRKIFDRASDGILIADAVTKKFLQGNATICSLLGYTKEEIESLSIYDIHPPQDISRVNTEFEKQIQGKKVISEELPVLRKDRSVFYADISSAPIIIGGRIYLVGIFHDITERKQAEQILRHQREELSQVSRLATVGEFTASIAHEIHQPLTAILNNARAALRFLSSDISTATDEVHDALQDIIDDVRRATDVIQHLRLFLKRKEDDQAIVDINTVIEEVLTILYGELSDKNVHVTQDLSPDIPDVKCSRVALQQVLLNLILNACDSLMNVEPQRRKMLIRTSLEEPKSVIVAIQDSGTGLDTNESERIFESYYTTKPEGLGMGLSISKSIISTHGGRIWAVNNVQGGATFYFTLPAQKGNTL